MTWTNTNIFVELRPNRLLLVGALVGLYFTTRVHYLLFHHLAEIFSIIVACSIFVIAFNTRAYLTNNYLQLLGTGYLFIGVLDLLHSLSYKGMLVFTDYDYYSTQVWIATRYLESLTLLCALLFLKKPHWYRPGPALGIYAGVTAVTILSIFVWKTFPICYLEGQGLTPFKIYSEYIICLILLLDIGLLFHFRAHFSETVFRFILLSHLFTIGSELAFTSYVSLYGPANIIGHYLKIISFYFIYKAMVETALRQPFDLIFKELKESERRLKTLSAYDPLTKLRNRRDFLECCEHRKRKSDQLGELNALIMGDIDRFKQFNDIYGHACGDEVLQQVAKVIEENLRVQDLVSRWGGEEFLIMLPQCPLEEAGMIAEKLRERIEQRQVNFQGQSLSVTISFGVVSYAEGTSIETAIKRADANLYRAKAKGRNQVALGTI